MDVHNFEILRDVCYVYVYLLHGMIIVSRRWSGVTNGEFYVWMWM